MPNVKKERMAIRICVECGDEKQMPAAQLARRASDIVLCRRCSIKKHGISLKKGRW